MLVLASQSPRRSEILRQAGIPFVVRAVPVDETPLDDEKPDAYVQRVAEFKALAVTAKPYDAEDAKRMLSKLSGRRHEVLTGICLKQGETVTRDWAVTAVWFTTLNAQEIDDYVSSGEPMDKAGAYAIQGLASKFVEKIDGCFFNVMGLPIALVYRHLKQDQM
jgi:septum formation protein